MMIATPLSSIWRYRNRARSVAVGLFRMLSCLIGHFADVHSHVEDLARTHRVTKGSYLGYIRAVTAPRLRVPGATMHGRVINEADFRGIL